MGSGKNNVNGQLSPEYQDQIPHFSRQQMTNLPLPRRAWWRHPPTNGHRTSPERNQSLEEMYSRMSLDGVVRARRYRGRGCERNGSPYAVSIPQRLSLRSPRLQALTVSSRYPTFNDLPSLFFRAEEPHSIEIVDRGSQDSASSSSNSVHNCSPAFPITSDSDSTDSNSEDDEERKEKKINRRALKKRAQLDALNKVFSRLSVARRQDYEGYSQGRQNADPIPAPAPGPNPGLNVNVEMEEINSIQQRQRIDLSINDRNRLQEVVDSSSDEGEYYLAAESLDDDEHLV